ncbi:MAG: nucleotidyl transferase AbiEii/AbiGii toxin family protein [Candidatus Sumerlaeota bacterium]|nr:nucleotidyl transferase AbiEii/AbiGii toxin family protein [Candidatus Sumerlaeota bacterium]
MIEIIRAAVELQSVCEAQRWRYCFIGGLALLRWGEPRETVDVDLTLLTGFGAEERFVEILLSRFDARIENAVQFALTRRVLLLRAKSGVGLDIALGGLPFEESAVARSSVFAFPPDARIRTCSAEDLIVMKAFAARAKDWLDVEGIIIRQAGTLDWRYIWSQLKPLAELKGAPEIPVELERRRVEFENQGS